MSVAPEFDKDRLYLSPNSNGPLWLRIMGLYGEDVKADDTPTLTLLDANSLEVGQGQVTYTTIPSTKVKGYRAVLPATAVNKAGPLTARWSYEVNDNSITENQYLVIGQSDPGYDQLSPDYKTMVEQTWLRMSDMFDSTEGGPWLRELVQTSFGRGKVGNFLPMVLGKINAYARTEYTLHNPFPVAKWGGLLELGLWIEVIRHLRRSYLEQPNVVGTQVARLDRSHYSSLWQGLQQDYERDLEDMLDSFKISQIGLQGSVLVAGGAYLRAPSRSLRAGSLAPRGIFFGRGY